MQMMPDKQPLASPQQRQAGVGLIEVLVAILVVSIGFLGMAALHARALSTNNSAMARSMVTIASYTMFDAMRADLASAMAGAYNKTVTANNCPDAGDSLASKQLNRWCEQLGATLGAEESTTGKIACSNTGKCTITITFDDSRAGVDDTGLNQDGRLSVEIRTLL